MSSAKVGLVGWSLGSIALFPQGVVPMIILLVGADVKSWFLALYLPGALQWPGAAVMAVFGAWLYYHAIKVIISNKPTPNGGDGKNAAEPAGTPEGQQPEFESI